jgi:hypothetical protein
MSHETGTPQLRRKSYRATNASFMRRKKPVSPILCRAKHLRLSLFPDVLRRKRSSCDERDSCATKANFPQARRVVSNPPPTWLSLHAALATERGRLGLPNFRACIGSARVLTERLAYRANDSVPWRVQGCRTGQVAKAVERRILSSGIRSRSTTVWATDVPLNRARLLNLNSGE